MLLDLDDVLDVINGCAAAVPMAAILGAPAVSRVATGVYDAHFNLGNALRLDGPNGPPWVVCDYPKMRAQQAAWDALQRRRAEGDTTTAWEPPDDKSDYGVADTLQQVLDYYADEVADPDAGYVIGLTTVRRDPENVGKRGGWRWHKWGPYIGARSPRCEYLDDEPEIESVVVFHLYRLDAPKTAQEQS